MTVQELIERVPEDKRELELTVVKHDKGQLSSNTTVPIKYGHIGFDWTQEQFVLEPAIKLVTDHEVVKDTNKDALEYFAGRVTKAMEKAAEISRMIEDMPDAELKTKIRSKLAEI